MNVQGKLIERALQRSDFDTYGELAEHLGVTPATMSQWRAGTSKLPTKRMEQFAELSGDDPGVWAIAMMAEESNVSTNLRSSILKVLKQSGNTIAIVASLIMSAALPLNAKAENKAFSADQPVAKICIMRNYG